MPENFVDLRKELVYNKKNVVKNVVIGSAVGLLAFETLSIFLQGKIKAEDLSDEYLEKLNKSINSVKTNKEILTNAKVNNNYSDVKLEDNNLSITNSDGVKVSYNLEEQSNVSIFKNVDKEIMCAYDNTNKILYLDGETYSDITEIDGVFKQDNTAIAEFNNVNKTLQIGNQTPFYATNETGDINFIKGSTNNIVGIYDEKSDFININDAANNINIDKSIIRDNLTDAKEGILSTIEAMEKDNKYNQDLVEALKKSVNDINLNTLDMKTYENFNKSLIDSMNNATNSVSMELGFKDVTEKINNLGLFDTLSDIAGPNVSGIVGLIGISAVLIALLSGLFAKTADLMIENTKEDLIKKKIITPEDVVNERKAREEMRKEKKYSKER